MSLGRYSILKALSPHAADALRTQVLEAKHPPSGKHPRRRPHLVERRLSFDRGEIDALVSSVDSATIRPRYQSDLFEEEDLERLDGQIAPLAPSTSRLVYNPDSGELQTLSPHAAEVLGRCDGSRTLEQVVEVFPEEVREDAARCVSEIARAGLLT